MNERKTQEERQRIQETVSTLKKEDLRNRIKTLEEQNSILALSRTELIESCNKLILTNSNRDSIISEEKHKLERTLRVAEVKVRQLIEEKTRIEKQVEELNEEIKRILKELETTKQAKEELQKQKETQEQEHNEILRRIKENLKVERSATQVREVESEKRILEKMINSIQNTEKRLHETFLQCQTRLKSLGERITNLEGTVKVIKEGSLSEINKMKEENKRKTKKIETENEELRRQMEEQSKRHDEEIISIGERTKSVLNSKEKAIQQRDLLIARLQGEIAGFARLGNINQ